ncbi:uncharacterized protein F5891DRAFT_1035025, partial [Suillus fuscotomentosus]
MQYIGQTGVSQGCRLDTEQSFSSETLQPSLTVLAPHEIRVFFHHVSDPSASYDEMLLGVNELYQEDFSYVALILNA